MNLPFFLLLHYQTTDFNHTFPQIKHTTCTNTGLHMHNTRGYRIDFQVAFAGWIPAPYLNVRSLCNYLVWCYSQRTYFPAWKSIHQWYNLNVSIGLHHYRSESGTPQVWVARQLSMESQGIVHAAELYLDYHFCSVLWLAWICLEPFCSYFVEAVVWQCGLLVAHRKRRS